MFKIRTLIGKHLYDHVISRGGRYGHIKLAYPRQMNGNVYVNIDSTSFFDFAITFRTLPTVCYLFLHYTSIGFLKCLNNTTKIPNTMYIFWENIFISRFDGMFPAGMLKQ